MGWRMALLVLGVLLWLVGIPLAMVARSRPQLYGYLPDGDTVLRGESGESTSGVSYGLTASQATKTRAFWFLSLLFAGQFIGLSGLMVHMIPLLEDFGYSSATAATILGLVFLFSGIGRLGSGFLADVIDHRIVLAVLLATQVVATLFLAMIGSGTYWQLIVFALFFGVGFGGTIPLRPILVIRLFGDRALGAIQGLMHGGAISAGMIGPILFGWVFDSTTEYTVALYLSAALAFAVIPLVFLMDSRMQTEQSHQ